jgi:hypothetical protein
MSVATSTSQAAFLFRWIDCFAGVDPDASGRRTGYSRLHASMK